MKTQSFVVLLGATVLQFLIMDSARAHCDALDGPVVHQARLALDKGEVSSVLKWVKPADEEQIRLAFARTVKVRDLGPEARELADQHFFETLVRIHRAGEGVAFSGLKPAGWIDPGIAAAEKTIQQGSAGTLARELGKAVETGIVKRFAEVMERKQHAQDSVEAGRAFVATYADYIHHVEAVTALTAVTRQHLHAQENTH
jgi:hypothetical protein